MKHHGAKHLRRLVCVTLSVTLALMTALPAWGAYNITDPETAGENTSDTRAGRTAAHLLKLNQTYKQALITADFVEVEESEFPETFDLRDYGYVTPVKLQNPYGTCWGFSTIVACESSILSELGLTYEETGLDLSEHHLAWFTRTPISDGSSQDGEGCYAIDGANPFNTGGYMTTATSVLSSGEGVVSEEFAPYRGYLGIWGPEMLPLYYSETDDWSIDEKYRYTQDYQLEETYLLPEPAYKEYNELETAYEYNGYDESATLLIKEQLMAGRAVSIAFCADQSQPNETTDGKYLSSNWCHYTYDNGEINHAVTIVGWDDTIQPSEFVDHSNDSDDGEAHQPPAAGAWIVKNSWGADTEEYPNKLGWGVQNEDGVASGYFYLSYYDKSISCPETFNFDVEDLSTTATIIDQYDLLPTSQGTNEAWVDTEELRTANVFTAEYDQDIYAVSCETAYANTTTSFEVYLMKDGATDPDNGELVASVEETSKFAGYHRVSLPETVSVEAGQKYSVIATQTIEVDDETLYLLNSDKAYNEEGTEFYNSLHDADHELRYYSKAVVNEGESYVYTDTEGVWIDWSAVIPELQTDDAQSLYAFDNFTIKAHATFSNADEAVSERDACIYPEAEHDYDYYLNQAIFWWIKVAALSLLGIVALIVVIVVLVKRYRKKHGKLSRKERKKLKKQQKLEAKRAATTGVPLDSSAAENNVGDNAENTAEDTAAQTPALNEPSEGAAEDIADA